MTRWLIVGGGAAGCVITSRLSEDPTNQVTLLEAGPDHGPDHATGDVGLYLDEPARWYEESGVVRRAGGSPEHYWQGRGLGGSSLLNGPVLVPNPDDADVAHLLPVETPIELGAIGRAVLAADPAAQPVLLSRRNGRRVSVADAYLRPFLERPNLTVITDTPVDHLIVRGRTVVGVAAVGGVEYLADRIVMCAGAIRTPALLLASGVDTPGIGEGLQDHPAFAVTLELVPDVVDDSVPNIVVGIDHPGSQILALNHLPGAPSYGSLIGALMTPTSVGRVTVDPIDGCPVVVLDQLSTESDLERLTDVACDVLALAAHPAVTAVARRALLDEQGTPIESLSGDRDATRHWVLDHLTGYHHVAGSCRRGTVTDERGAVRDYEGLWVGDASLFDGVPPINPYLSVITLAERLSARWRDSTTV